MSIAIGVDGCRAGWLCLGHDSGSGATTAWIAPSFVALVTTTPRPDVLAIDIPIGLPDRGSRACDVEARHLLGVKRGSSVFPAPIRPLLTATSYHEAAALRKEVEGKSISRQAFGILPKVRDVDSVMSTEPRLQSWIREVHPEVTFRLWNGGQPMAFAKKSRDGRGAREALIDRAWPQARAVAAAQLGRGGWAADDLNDAFAALWTARRIVSGLARLLPSHIEMDRTGLRMEMLA